MRLYHFGFHAEIEAILREGFRDGRPYEVNGRTYRGVWLSDVPLLTADDPEHAAEMAVEHAQVVVDVPAHLLDEYEVVGNPVVAESHREWCIPADLVNSLQRARATEERGA
jgi:hypothetical protein